MVVVTRLGDFRTQFIAGALLGGILLLTRQWRPAIFAIGTLVGTALANQTLKTLFARARPEVLAEPLSSFSFPSGHSSASFAFFLTLGVLASRQQPPRWRLTWVLLAVIPSLSIALSRVYLGVHWPSDIVAGALLATTVCAASLWLSQRRESPPALPQRVWWLLLPVCVATLAIAAGWACRKPLRATGRCEGWRSVDTQLALQVLQQHLDPRQLHLRVGQGEQFELAFGIERQQVGQLVGQVLLAAGLAAHLQRGHHRMLGQHAEQRGEIVVFVRQGLLRQVFEPLDLADAELVGLDLHRQHLETPTALHADAQQAVRALLPVADRGLAADHRQTARRFADLRPSPMVTTPKPVPCFMQRLIMSR